MQMLLRGGVGLALVATGYFLGTTGILKSPPAHAQVQPGNQDLNEDTQARIQSAYEALIAAKEALKTEGRYNPVTGDSVLNTFGILTGGVNAIQDLESGRGVDPETFAALYAGLAEGEIRAHLERDAEGRLTYKNKVIRMYPISRLKQEFQRRKELGGLEE